jgi:hypothetical protein
MDMENYDAALPLMTENLRRKRRLLGDDSQSTLASVRNLVGRTDLLECPSSGQFCGDLRDPAGAISN